MILQFEIWLHEYWYNQTEKWVQILHLYVLMKCKISKIVFIVECVNNTRMIRSIAIKPYFLVEYMFLHWQRDKTKALKKLKCIPLFFRYWKVQSSFFQSAQTEDYQLRTIGVQNAERPFHSVSSKFIVIVL